MIFIIKKIIILAEENSISWIKLILMREKVIGWKSLKAAILGYFQLWYRKLYTKISFQNKENRRF